jgi:hypothetical protein
MDAITMPVVPKDHVQNILQTVATWGKTTTIIIHHGCVFEFKGEFPKGELGFGYYNLKGEHGFEGHIKLENIESVQLQRKMHAGKEAYAFVFNNKSGDSIFKIFLGRDEDGEIIPHQLDWFHELEAKYI